MNSTEFSMEAQNDFHGNRLVRSWDSMFFELFIQPVGWSGVGTNKPP